MFTTSLLKIAEAYSKMPSKGRKIGEAVEIETIEGIPNWASTYIMYGDDSGLSEEDKKEVDDFIERLDRNGYRLVSPERGTENEFNAHPAFGGGCDTQDWTAEVTNVWKTYPDVNDMELADLGIAELPKRMGKYRHTNEDADDDEAEREMKELEDDAVKNGVITRNELNDKNPTYGFKRTVTTSAHPLRSQQQQTANRQTTTQQTQQQKPSLQSTIQKMKSPIVSPIQQMNQSLMKSNAVQQIIKNQTRQQTHSPRPSMILDTDESKNRCCNESSDGFRVYIEDDPIDVLRDKCWECDDLYEAISNADAEEAFNDLATETFPDGVGLTEFNDWCRFDSDSIMDSLGISEEDDEIENDEDEVNDDGEVQ